MKRISFLCLCLFLLASSCQSQKEPKKPIYPRSIGDISFDPSLDDPHFQPCTERRAVQYFAFGEKPFAEEKIQIIRTFQRDYDPNQAVKESGLIRIRFLVNCKGETDRFRVIGMNWNYQEKVFDKSITDQLLTITKGLNSWKVFSGNNRDYYMYLIFKIEEGTLVEILP